MHKIQSIPKNSFTEESLKKSIGDPRQEKSIILENSALEEKRKEILAKALLYKKITEGLEDMEDASLSERLKFVTEKLTQHKNTKSQRSRSSTSEPVPIIKTNLSKSTPDLNFKPETFDGQRSSSV